MMDKLEDIGFYTLSDERAAKSSVSSPLWRCELILTDKCNFRCPYCRGLKPGLRGNMDLYQAEKTLDYWLSEGLRNVRFSGGEPTIYKALPDLVRTCKQSKVEHIAVSTNGSAPLKYYERLISLGLNDLSISLDAGCCSIGDAMAGGKTGSWDHTVDIIRELSRVCYVTVGMVFTETNINDCLNAVLFADSLGVADIRVIPAAQYNRALQTLSALPDSILKRHPILSYRINNIRQGLSVRGTGRTSCPLVLDDMAVAGKWHFPCIIYMREGGKPIGEVSTNMRGERLEWYDTHNPSLDSICKQNCLDVCVEYNAKWDSYRVRGRDVPRVK
jgi:MoaA/NifB/PqqE/SkfB family radical SAM enzyme